MVLAILALISVPITIRIINNARENSYKRSIESYAKALENYIAMKNIDNASNDYDLLYNYVNDGDFDNTYSGHRVECDYNNSSNSDENYSTLINGKLFLRGCRIVQNNSKVSKDTYMFNDGKISREPQIDYHVGDPITVAGEKYYVLRDSKDDSDYVVALKKDVLTKMKVSEYGDGHINQYLPEDYDDYQQPTDKGGIRYYNGPTCGYVNDKRITNGCTSVYDDSNIKIVVDNWALDCFKNNELKQVGGYYARLINEDDLKSFDYYVGSYLYYYPNKEVPYWFWNTGSIEWTMIPRTWYTIYVVGSSEILWDAESNYLSYTVRPVINVYKDKISN